MNPDLQKLQTYPFEKLKKLQASVSPVADKAPISLGIGEPKHASPQFVLEALANSLSKVAVYPKTLGDLALRQSIASWATTRFELSANSLTPERHILPVNGTREALFAFAQAMIDRSKNPLLVSPNPFYQIYEGAAMLAGAEPYFLPCLKEQNYIPDYDSVSDDVWQRCQILFLCSPGNPTGAVIDIATLKKLVGLADKFDFIVAADECYSEIYFDEDRPPCGLLQACAEMGRDDYRRCMVFHSLSKRSNLPGLRSGFVAGDKDLIKPFLRYRTYHGCAMAEPVQQASIAAWSDEQHVVENRKLYKAKFDAVLDLLGDCLDVKRPEASFYLWPKTPIDDCDFAQQLYAKENVTVLPGQYLSRTVDGFNPGQNHLRLALVAGMDECLEATNRIKRFVGGFG